MFRRLCRVRVCVGGGGLLTAFELINSNLDVVDFDALIDLCPWLSVRQLIGKPFSVLRMDFGTVHRGIGNTSDFERILFWVSVVKKGTPLLPPEPDVEINHASFALTRAEEAQALESSGLGPSARSLPRAPGAGPSPPGSLGSEELFGGLPSGVHCRRNSNPLDKGDGSEDANAGINEEKGAGVLEVLKSSDDSSSYSHSRSGSSDSFHSESD